MFTWISKFSGLSLLLLLWACGPDGGPFAPYGQSRTLAVVHGAMQIAAPTGYCVDKQSARRQADGAVVLMGRCSGGSDHAAAVISVTIGDAGSAAVLADGGDALAAFFQTAAGRSALSSTGNAASVQIVQTATEGGDFILRISETGAGEYWRAVVGISGRLVTLSVQAPTDQALDTATGKTLLKASIIAMRRANPPLKALTIR